MASATSGTSPSFVSSDMPSEELSFLSMLQHLPEKIAKEMDLDGIARFFLHLFTDHIIPAILFAAAFVALYHLGLVVSRVVWPPSAQELHNEAVILLKKGSAVDKLGSNNRTKALKLLRAAIAKDPEQEVAYVTLASELLYGENGKDIEQALTVLQDAKQRFPKSDDEKSDDELEKLLDEAGAIKTFGKSQGRMAGVGRSPLR
jgi:tetratricopeptide (TPR) repeat protein